MYASDPVYRALEKQSKTYSLLEIEIVFVFNWNFVDTLQSAMANTSSTMTPIILPTPTTAKIDRSLIWAEKHFSNHRAGYTSKKRRVEGKTQKHNPPPQQPSTDSDQQVR